MPVPAWRSRDARCIPAPCRGQGTVTPEVRRTLSIISWELLLPSMAFYNIVLMVSDSNIGTIWPFAANTVLQCVQPGRPSQR